MTMVVVGVVIVFAFLAVLRLARTCDRHDEDVERHFHDEANQWAAEVENVPLDWLDALDSIRRLPERIA